MPFGASHKRPKPNARAATPNANECTHVPIQKDTSLADTANHVASVVGATNVERASLASGYADGVTSAKEEVAAPTADTQEVFEHVAQKCFALDAVYASQSALVGEVMREKAMNSMIVQIDNS